MNYLDLIDRARTLVKKDNREFEEKYYTESIAWFKYLGLVDNNKIQAKRCRPSLDDILKAGALEPRLLEVLPAVMLVIPKAVAHEKGDIPQDLEKVISDLRTRKCCDNFRGVAAHKIHHWVYSAIIRSSKLRLNYRKIPRNRKVTRSHFGDIIREGRIKLALTQEAFAKKYKVSLRILRDLEQGKTKSSIASLEKILKALGRTLSA